MFKNRKLAGIYKIEHNTGMYYIGMSVDIFGRWSSHYHTIKLKKHSSVAFMELWNATIATEWTFSVLEVCSLSEFRYTNKLVGKASVQPFRSHLLRREKWQMSQHSITYALNKANKHFQK